MLRRSKACFGGGATISTSQSPIATTSFYATHLGNASLTWRRVFFGISVVADFWLFPAQNTENETDFRGDDFHFRLLRFPLWNRRGSKRLRLRTSLGHLRVVDLAWDLSEAAFANGNGPEPASGYFFAVAINGDLALVAGDRPEEAHRRIRTMQPGYGEIGSPPISRRVELRLGMSRGEMSWKATAQCVGREKQVSASIDLDEMEMSLEIEGERVLRVTRLCWKFRGSERVVAKGGERILVSWDLHRCLFCQDYDGESSPASEKDWDALFVIRFEKWEDGEEDRDGYSGNGRYEWRYFGHYGEGRGKSSDSLLSKTTTVTSSSSPLWSPDVADVTSSEAGWFTLIVIGRKI